MAFVTTNKKFITCRTIGHSWDHLPHQPGEPVIRLRCVRCAMERIDTVNVSTGEVEGRRYIAPLGYYLSVSGEERPSKNEWRTHFLVVAGITYPNGRKGRLR